MLGKRGGDRGDQFDQADVVDTTVIIGASVGRSFAHLRIPMQSEEVHGWTDGGCTVWV